MRRSLFFASALWSLALLGWLTACGGDGDGGSNQTSDNVRYELPRPKKSGNTYMLSHYTSEGLNYTVEWDIDKKSQRWTAYQMDPTYQGSAGRAGDFMEDPELPKEYRLDDTYSYYRGSGFTRGHICPSADRQYSVEANRQTFYYTNMQPQYYNFNAGDNYGSPWVRLENLVRTWAKSNANEKLYVVKGGTIEDDQLLTTIRGGLRVPKYFFVAVVKKQVNGWHYGIGFWMLHENREYTGQEPLTDYLVNIRELERKTGIDFFYQFPDDIEEPMETQKVENIKKVWNL